MTTLDDIIKTVKSMTRSDLEAAHMAHVAAKWGEKEAAHPSNARALKKKHTTTLRIDHANCLGAAAGLSHADTNAMIVAITPAKDRRQAARFGLHGNS